MDIQSQREMGFWGRVNSLSVFKRILLMVVTVPVTAIILCFARIAESFVLKIVLSLLCITGGYAFWILLFSFTPKRAFRIAVVFMLVIIPVAVLVNVFGDFSFLNHSYYPSNMELLSSETAPCGDYSAEAYQVSVNEDGTFRGKVYLAYSPTGKKHMYQNTKKALYENDKLEKLDLQWQDDKTLLVNGAEVEVYP